MTGHIKDEGSIIGWALQNSDRLSKLRQALNRRMDFVGAAVEDKFEDNEELIVHLLDDIIEVYEDKVKNVS